VFLTREACDFQVSVTFGVLGNDLSGNRLTRQAELLRCSPSSAQNPKPAGPGRERYRCLRQERIIKARDSAMLTT
jgi:hypothetical protein